MTATPLFLENLTNYSATDLRQLIDATFANAGVISGGVVSQRAAGANRSVDVSAIVAVVDGTDIPATQGKYLGQQPLTNVPLATAPVTGQSRIDSIIAQVLDGDQNGNAGVNEFIVTVQAGTPATTGSQVAPTLPKSCVLLANVLVGPTVTTIVNANITDERIFTVAGGPVPNCRVHLATGIALVSTLNSHVTFDTVDYDSTGSYSLANKQYVVPRTGTYLITMTMSVDPTSTTVTANLLRTGSVSDVAVGPAASTANPTSGYITGTLSVQIRCVVGDILIPQVYIAAGVGPLEAGASWSHMEIAMVSS